ncbi:MAG: MoaD/ThiS family protein [Candidatus Helarchaeota archaeon]
MLLKIRFYSTLKTLIGKEELQLRLNSEEFTLEDLIRKLGEQFSSKFEDEILNNNKTEIKPEILIFVNDREIRLLQNLKTQLYDGYQIAFVPSIHGGSEIIY